MIFSKSGDDLSIFTNEIDLGKLIEKYFLEILHENPQNIEERVYIFIDEVHLIENWQVWLKNYYDKSYNIKFIISGSSSSHLFDGSKESLLGRYESIKVLPLSFIEYCKFYSEYNNDEKIKEYLKLIPKINVYENIKEYYEFLKNNEMQFLYYMPYLNKVLEEYLIVGGYPEYFEVKNISIWQKRLVEDIVAQGLYRDIIQIFNIKSPKLLEKMLYFIAENSGQIFNNKTLADTLGVDNETIQNYLQFLNISYLIISLENYSTNMGKILRKPKKQYILDTGIANALLHYSSIDSRRTGTLIETLSVKHVLDICEKNFWNIRYWSNKDNEVDIVIDKNTVLFPIEVKYRNKASDYASGLHEFKKHNENSFIKVNEKLMITKDELNYKDNVYFIPFIFLN